MGEFPLFSPIPWATSTNPNERYPSPPADGISSAATMYPMSNGINGMGKQHDEDMNVDDTPQMSTGAPPPIDAVDIGIVPDEVARAAQEGGPPPRSPQDLNVSIHDKEAHNMDIDER
jgi:hypothetical protein